MTKMKPYHNQTLEEIRARYHTTETLGDDFDQFSLVDIASYTDENIAMCEYVLTNWKNIFNKGLRLNMGHYNTERLEPYSEKVNSAKDYLHHCGTSACFLGYLMTDEKIYEEQKGKEPESMFPTLMFGDEAFQWLFESDWEDSLPCCYHRLALFYANGGKVPSPFEIESGEPHYNDDFDTKKWLGSFLDFEKPHLVQELST